MPARNIPIFEIDYETGEEVQLKKCTRCSKELPLSEFHVDRGISDGHAAQCKECTLERLAPYFKTHRAENLERVLIWQAEHPEKPREYKRKHKKAHPEEMLAYKRRRNARIAENGGHYTREEWVELCVRFDNRCVCCGEKKLLEPDHVVPVAKGGSSDISNIQPLCARCNVLKHVKIIDYRLRWTEQIGKGE